MCLFLWFVVVFLFLASAGEWNQEQHRFAWNDDTRRAIIFHCVLSPSKPNRALICPTSFKRTLGVRSHPRISRRCHRATHPHRHHTSSSDAPPLSPPPFSPLYSPSPFPLPSASLTHHLPPLQFGFLWVRAWILAVGNLVIAGAVCDWFIVHDRSLLSSPVFSSFLRTLRFHTGTAAFGALIIATVQIIRWIFRYYMYQLSKFNKDSVVIKLFACIGECCLSCLERFLKFINRNAYIQTAMKGTSFCTSAKTVCPLLCKHLTPALRGRQKQRSYCSRRGSLVLRESCLRFPQCIQHITRKACEDAKHDAACAVRYRFARGGGLDAQMSSACHDAHHPMQPMLITHILQATMLIIRNCLRVGALAAIGTIFNNIGKLFIAVVTGLICALIIQGGDYSNVQDAPVFSVTIITILAFGIGAAFIDVWDVVTETLFQCFCMDIEKGSGKTSGQFKAFIAENEGKTASKSELHSQI